MYISERTADIEKFESNIFDMYFGGMSFATFDIESTGLSPKYCELILSGFCKYDGGLCTSTQIFAESLDDEAEVLERTLSYMSNLDFVVTYNGARFDIPFLEERLKKHGVTSYSLPFNFDLLPAIRKFSDIKSFTPNLRQKTVEAFMGLWTDRTDEIDGGQSVEMYYDYLVSRREELKEKILLHNHDDVLQLYRLMAVTKRIDMHGALAYYGFPVKTPLGLFTAKSVKLSRNNIEVQGLQPKGEARAYVNPGRGEMKREFRSDGSFKLAIPILKNEGLLLADLRQLEMDEEPFADLPTYGSGYLIVKNENDNNQMEINLLVKKIIERIVANEL